MKNVFVISLVFLLCIVQFEAISQSKKKKKGEDKGITYAINSVILEDGEKKSTANHLFIYLSESQLERFSKKEDKSQQGKYLASLINERVENEGCFQNRNSILDSRSNGVPCLRVSQVTDWQRW